MVGEGKGRRDVLYEEIWNNLGTGWVVWMHELPGSANTFFFKEVFMVFMVRPPLLDFVDCICGIRRPLFHFADNLDRAVVFQAGVSEQLE